MRRYASACGGAIPLRKAIDYEVQIAHGLAAAHEKGIVHRDLKPENLFIMKDGRVKILDFGLAKVIEQKFVAASNTDDTMAPPTEAGMVLGTVGYMSPEQVRRRSGRPSLRHFSFGTILYEMVTGKKTFGKPTSAETMTAILNEEPSSISQLTPGVPPGLQRVVHRCLEKHPEQRFQSASDLAFALEALSDSAMTMSSTSVHAVGSAKANTRKLLVSASAFAALVLIGAVIYWWMKPPAPLNVSNYVQLTHDGQPKSLVGTDGLRLYMNLGYFSSNQGIAVIPVTGGDPAKISVPSTRMQAYGLSPDGAELLVGDVIAGSSKSLWSLPVLGGSPRRLGDLTTINGASWSLDGKMLAYAAGGGVGVAKSDGSEPRQILSFKDQEYGNFPEVSPDGTHVRYTQLNNTNASQSLWEVSVDGKDAHPLLPGWHNPPLECCGFWTVDGKYFLFANNNQIWSLPAKKGFLRAEAKPMQLTSSPLALYSMIPSRDGKKLFVVGGTSRGELMRYNSKTGEIVSAYGGISGDGVDFSKDGKWMTYMSFPDGVLWRSRTDGSDRLQLTNPPNHALMPRWSPDGSKIVFFEIFSDKKARMFEISASGGTPQQILPDDTSGQGDPSFSPGGDKLIFASIGFDSASTVRILDLATRKVVTVPGSAGIFSPRWSPNGRYIVGLSSDQGKALLFDSETQKWTELATGGLGWPRWSKDGEYIYVLSTADRAVLKIKVSTGTMERVADLKNFKPAGEWGWLLALAPDDSLLLLKDAERRMCTRST